MRFLFRKIFAIIPHNDGTYGYYMENEEEYANKKNGEYLTLKFMKYDDPDAYEVKKTNQLAREKRRNVKVTELGEDGKLREVFQWIPGSEQFYPADPLELLERSDKLRSISDSYGWSTAQAAEELNKRAKIFDRGPDLADVDWVLLGFSCLAYPSAGYPAQLSPPIAG